MPNVINTNVTIQPGQYLTDELSNPGDRRRYSINLSAGQYVFELDAFDIASTNNVGVLSDPYIRIYDSTGNTYMAGDDDSGPGLNSFLRFTAPTTDTYIVEVARYADWAGGEFRLTARTLTDYDGGVAAQPFSGGGTPTTPPPVLAIAAGAAQDEGGTFTFNVTRTGDTAGYSSVNWNLVTGGADVSDFSGATSGTVYFGPGETAQSVSLASLNDEIVEGAETFSVSLDAASVVNGSVGTGSANNTINASDAGTDDEPLANSGTALTLTAGIAATGSLEYRGDHDWFRFQTTAAGRYVFNLDGIDVAGNATGRLNDAWLDLNDASGNRITYNDDGGGNLNSLIDTSLAANTTYYLSAGAYANYYTGDYQLSARAYVSPADDEPLANSATTRTIAAGQYATGTLEATGDHDWFAISLTAGQSYVFNLDGADLASTETVGALRDSWLDLYGTDGATRLTYNDDSGGNLNSLINGFVPSATGTYYLAAGAYANYYQGDYRLTARLSSDTSPAVPVGTTVPVTLVLPTVQIASSETTVDEVTVFDAEGNDTGNSTYSFTITRSEGTGTSSVQWSVAPGSADAGDFGGSLPSGTVTFEPGITSQTISFPVLADRITEGAETFSVSLSYPTGATLAGSSASATITDDSVGQTDAVGSSLTDNTPALGAMSVGTSTTGTLEFAGDHDWYAITLTGNATYQFDMVGFDHDTSNNFGRVPDSWLDVLDSAGNRIAYNDDSGGNLNSRISGFVAPSTGTYYLSAGAYVNYYTGDYELSATLQAAPPAPLVVLSASDYQLGEGGTYTFWVSRSGDLSQDSVVSWSVDALAETAGFSAADFVGGVLPSGTVSFAGSLNEAYQSFTISTVDDADIEGEQQFTVSLRSAGSSNADISGAQSAAGVIVDNDVAAVPVITDDYGDTINTNGRLELGRYAVGEINPNDDHDWFAIDLNQGESYVFDLQGVSLAEGTIERLADSYLTIYDGEGNYLAHDDDSGSGLDSHLSYTVAGATGTYYLGASSWAHYYNGGYQISARTQAQFNHDENPEIDLPIVLDPIYIGAPTELPASVALTCQNTLQNEGTGGTTAYTFLVTRSGNMESEFSVSWAVETDAALGEGAADSGDFVEGGMTGTVSFAAGQSEAVITVQVAADSSIEGDESFSVRITDAGGNLIEGGGIAGFIQNDDQAAPTDDVLADDYLASVNTGGILNEGGAGITGVLEQRGDEDWFKVSLTAGTSYTFDLGGTAVTPTLAGQSHVDAAAYGVGDTWMNLYDTGGGLITADDDSGDGLNSRLSFTPTESGNYYIGVRAYADYYTGGYQLNVVGDHNYTTDAEFSFTRLDINGFEGSSGVPTMVDGGSDPNTGADDTVVAGSPFVFTVHRGGQTDRISMVDWGFAQNAYGAPVTARDFDGGELPMGGTITFAADETDVRVTVNVVGDTDYSFYDSTSDDFASVEYFNLVLGNAVGGAIVEGRGMATGAIYNDDDDEVGSGGFYVGVGARQEAAFQLGDTGDMFTLGGMAAYDQTSAPQNDYYVYTVSTGYKPVLTPVAVSAAGEGTVGTSLPSVLPLNLDSGNTENDTTTFDVYRVRPTADQLSNGRMTFAVTPSHDMDPAALHQPYLVGLIRAGDDDFGGNRDTLGRMVATQNGGFVAGMLSGVADEDWFQIDLAEGQRYDFSVLGNTDVTLEVLDAEGRSLSNRATDRANPFLMEGYVPVAGGITPHGFTAERGGRYYVSMRTSVDTPSPYAIISRLVSTPETDVATSYSLLAKSSYVLEGASGATAYLFTAYREGDASQAADVDWTVADGVAGQMGTATGANADADDVFANWNDLVNVDNDSRTAGVQRGSGFVHFRPGETEADFTVMVQGDATRELNERLRVSITGASDGIIDNAYASADGLIRQDSAAETAGLFRTVAVGGGLANAEGMPQFGMLTAGERTPYVDELDDDQDGNTTETLNPTTDFVFAVTRSAVRGDSLSEAVTWRVNGASVAPMNGADFVAASGWLPTTANPLPTGTVTFTGDQLVKYVTVSVRADTLPEAAESFAISIAPAAAATAADRLRVETGTVTATVNDDDQEAEIQGFAIRPKMNSDQTVNYADRPEDGGNNGADGFTAFTFTVTRPSSDFYASVDDNGDPILNDLGDPVMAQTASAVRWRVTSSTAAGTANAADFVGGESATSRLPTGIVYFERNFTDASKEVTVFVATDNVVEGDETFTVRLADTWRTDNRNLSRINTATQARDATAYVGAGVQEATGRIRDDDNDAPTVSLAALNAARPEGNSGATPFTFLVSRRGNLFSPSTVTWTYEPGENGQPSASDFVGGVLPGATPISFAANQASRIITINVQGDTNSGTDDADDEPFTVRLTGGTNVSISTDDSADALIMNDDVASVDAWDDLAGNTMDAAAPALAPRDMGTLATSGSNTYSYTDHIWAVVNAAGDTAGDNDDWYRLSLPDMANISNLQLQFVDPDGLEPERNVTIEDDDGNAIGSAAAQNRPDLDLALYDANGTLLGTVGSTLTAISRSGRTATNAGVATQTLPANQGGFTINWSNGSSGLSDDATSTVFGSASLTGFNNLAEGTYYVRVHGFAENAEARYNLGLTTTAVPDTAGNAMNAAAPALAPRRLTLNELPQAIAEPLTHGDQDFYTFTTTTATAFRANIAGMTGNVDLRLLDVTGNIIASSSNTGTDGDGIEFAADVETDTSAQKSDALAAGTYYLWATSPEDASTVYNLTVSAPPSYDDNSSWDNFADAALTTLATADDWNVTTANPIPNATNNTLGGASQYRQRVVAGTHTATAPLRVSGSVDGVDTEDFFAISVTPDSQFSINMTRTRGSGNADMQLIGLDGQVMAIGTEGANGSETLALDEVATGNYVVRVAQYAGSAAYTLSMSAATPIRIDVPGEDAATARALTTTAAPLRSMTQRFSESVGYYERESGANVVDDSDWHRVVVGPYAGTLTATLSGLTSSDDATLALADSSGNAITSGVSFDADTGVLTYAGSASATYFVKAVAASGHHSAYNLGVSYQAADGATGNTVTYQDETIGYGELGLVGVARAQAGTPINAVTRADYVGIEDETDVWHFTTDRRSNLTVRLNGGTATSAMTGDADAVLYRITRDGSTVTSMTEVGRSTAAGTAAEGIALTNAEAGEYVVVASIYSGSATDAQYTLSVDAQAPTEAGNNARTAAGAQRLTPTVQTQTIDGWVGVVHYAAPSDFAANGSLNNGVTLGDSSVDQFDYYRVSVSAPTVLEAGLNTGSVAGMRVLAGTGGDAITADEDGAYILQATAATDFFIEVSRGTQTDASYSLNYSTRLLAPIDQGGEAYDSTNIRWGAGSISANVGLTGANTTAFAGANALAATGVARTFSDRLGLAVPTATNPRNDNVDDYRFTVTGSPWDVTATLTGLEDNANLVLLRSDGTSVASSVNGGAVSESLTAELPVGTYYVRVMNASGTGAQIAAVETGYTVSLAATVTDDSPDNYAGWTAATRRLAIDGLPTPATTPPVTSTQANGTRYSVTGRVEAGGDVDLVSVSNLIAGQSYVVRQSTPTTALAGVPSLADGQILGIYDASGTLVANTANDDENGSTRDALVAFRPTATGTYYIAVAGANAENVGRYTVSVARENRAPTVSYQFGNQVAYEGQAYSLRLPWNMFDDPEGDALSFTATQATQTAWNAQTMVGTAAAPVNNWTAETAAGRALPDWLHFDADAQMFTGTAPAGSANVNVRVTAADADGHVTPYDFVLRTDTVPDDYGRTIGSVLGSVDVGGVSRGTIETPRDVDWFAFSPAAGQGGSYIIDLRGASSGAGTLVDPMLQGVYRRTGTAGHYSATLMTGSSNNDAAGSPDARVTIDLSAGETYYVAAAGTGEGLGSYTVGVTRATINHAPLLVDQDAGASGIQGVADLRVRVGTALRYEVPAGLFTDTDAGDRLSYTATKLDGTALPSWLRFDAATRTFTSAGNVAANTADVGVRVTARDTGGLAASDEFVIVTDPAQAAGGGVTGSSSSGGVASGGSSSQASSWTIMVYMAADNDLEQYALQDINEMEEAIRRNTGLRNVNVVVQIDRAQGYYTGDGNWTDTRRGRLVADTDPNSIRQASLTTVGEKDMGSGSTLTEFVNWASDTYRANNYALVLWDHGGGLSGTCLDFQANSSLSVAETTQAIAGTNIGRVDVLGFDTCLQGMVEQAYDLRVGSGDSLRTLADYVVASENLEPGDGWDYLGWLRSINGNSNDRNVALQAVRTYGQEYHNEQTLSAVDTSALDELVASINAFVDATDGSGTIGVGAAMQSGVDDTLDAAERNAVAAARLAANNFHDDGYRDLGAFMQNLSRNQAVSQSVRAAARNVSQALEEAVVARTDVDGTSGLSIFLPGNGGSSHAADYTNTSFRFVADSNWNNFLSAVNA